jgi:hypothetical protein
LYDLDGTTVHKIVSAIQFLREPPTSSLVP